MTTRKCLTIDDCRACPFGKTRNYVNPGNPMSRTELFCSAITNERRKIGDYVVGIRIEIPEWCPLVDADELMEAFVAIESKKAVKNG